MTNKFATAATQRDLEREIANAKMTAPEWIALAKEVTGVSCRSGRIARDTVHTHYSDMLLLNERVNQVRKSFA
jgi:hypothetical protein